MLKNLHKDAITYITTLTNAIFTLRKFPEYCKTAQIILITRSGKPKNIPSSYRVISLLSALSKLIERIIHKKITEIVKEKEFIPLEQWVQKRTKKVKKQEWYY